MLTAADAAHEIRGSEIRGDSNNGAGGISEVHTITDLILSKVSYLFSYLWSYVVDSEWSVRRDSNSLALFSKEFLYQQIGLSLRRVVPRVVPLWPGDDHGSECHQTNHNSILGPLLPRCSEQQREDQS